MAREVDVNAAPRTPGCRCSDQQLNLVGCDCEALELPLMVAEVFIDGYASDNKGKFEFVQAPGFDADEYARQTYGQWARIFNTYRRYPAPDTRTPAEREAALAYAREMTRGDNT